MLLESDSSWLTLAGPYPMLPRLSAPVSGVDRPCPWIHANLCCSPLCCPAAHCPLLGRVVNSRLRPAPTALSAVQPPTALCWVASLTLIRVPLPLPDTARFHVQESFVWFRAKTDSSALAAYPHSATPAWRHRILWHCSRCVAKRYISPIPVYYLPRLCA